MMKKGWIHLFLVLLMVLGFAAGCAPPAEEPTVPEDTVETDDGLFSMMAYSQSMLSSPLRLKSHGYRLLPRPVNSW